MKAYTLNITRNGITETVKIQPDQTAAVQAQPGAAYQLLDEHGKLVVQPDIEWVGDDLWVYTGETRGSTPDLVLQGYRTSLPVQNQQYAVQAGNTFAAADEAAWQQTARPVAEEVVAGGSAGSMKLWGAAALASGLAAAGLAASRRGGDTADGAAEAQSAAVSNQPETAAPAAEPSIPAADPEQPSETDEKTEEPSTPVVQPERPSETDGKAEEPSTPVVQPEQPSETDGKTEEPSTPVVQPEQPSETDGNTEEPSTPVVQPEQPSETDGKAEEPSTPVVQPEQPSETDGKTEEPSTPVVQPEQPSETDEKAEEPSTPVVQPEQPSETDGKAEEPSTPVVQPEQPSETDEKTEEPSTPVVQPEKPSETDEKAEEPSAPEVILPQPVITLHTLADDDIINAAESQAPVTVSGTVENAREGGTVTIAVGSKSYTATVQNGTFSVQVEGAVLAAASEIRASVQTADASGNTASATKSHTYRVDTEITQPVITFNKIAGDDIINARESQSPITVSGRVEHVRENDKVVLTAGGKTYEAFVQNGTFSAQVEGAVLAGGTEITAKIQTADASGNTASATKSHTYRVDTEIMQPVITFNKIADDDIINARESQSPITVSGRVEHARENDKVVLTAGGKTYEAFVENGTFSVQVEGAVLAAAREIRASVQTADASGNTALATASHTYRVDTEIMQPVITFNKIAGDDIINLAESQTESVWVSGTVRHAAENDEIVLKVGEAVYRGRVADGAFKVAVDTKTLLNHGKISASLTTSDEAQNSATGTAERDYRIDTEYTPTISLNKIAGDNVLNIEESKGTVKVTGTVTDVADGEDVIVSCGCESCGTVRWIDMVAKVRDGAFTVEFSGADMKGSTYNLVKAKVTSSDDAGNQATVETRQSYTKDLEAPQVKVSVDAVGGDDILGSEERLQPEHTVSGTVSGLQEGERIISVDVRVNGESFRAQTDGAAYRVSVPTLKLAAAEEVGVSVVVEDTAGNRAVAEGSRSYQNRTPSPVIELNPVASDGFISKAEADSNSIMLSGRVQHVADGTTVYLNVGSQRTSAQVSDGLFSVNVQKTFFGIGNNTKTAEGTLTASVTGGDGGGETVTASLPYRIDLANETAISIDSITTDNVLDENEMQQTHVKISGKVTDGRAGETVTVTVNKVDYTAPLQENGTYSVDAEIARIIPNKAEGKYAVTAKVKRIDQAGNEAGSEADGSNSVIIGRVVRVDSTPPVGVIVFDPIAGDNNLNSKELGAQNIEISGKVTRLSEGDDVQSVKVRVGRDGVHEYQAAVTGSVFKVSIPVNVLKTYTLVGAQADIKDATGRTAQTELKEQGYTQRTEAPSVTVGISSINGGKDLNAAQLSETVSIKGSVTAGDTVVADSVSVSVLINGKAYTPVLSGSEWTLNLPATTLAYKEGRLNISATATVADKYGNTAGHTASGSYIVDTSAPVPVIVLNPIAEGNVIGDAQKNGSLTVSGRVQGDFKNNDTVVLEFGGLKREVQVNGSGVFSISVEGRLLAEAAASVVKASVATRDDAGNTGSAQTSLAYTVKNGNINIVLDEIAGDGLVNVTEAGQKITLSGRVSGADALPGQKVLLLANGETLQADIQADGRFSTQIDAAKLLADTDYTVQASVGGRSGAAAKTSITYEVAAEAAAKIDITRIGGGFGIDVSQVAENTRITGRIELQEGVFTEGMNDERLRQITVTVGDKAYSAGIKTDRSFFFDIPTKELAALNGKPLSFAIDSDPVLYDLVQTGNNAYRVNRLAKNTKVDMKAAVKSIELDSPLLVKDADGVYTVSNAAEGKVRVSGRAEGSAKEGDTVDLEVGGKVYTAKLGRDLSFSADVAAQDMAADTDRAVRAVLHTKDLSGKAVSVADTEHYAAPNSVSGVFVSSHAKAPAAINSDHSSEGYNFPYFIQHTGNTNGGSYRIPFGGRTDGPAVIKYHFMTLDEIAKLPDNYNRYVDKSSTTTYSHNMQELVRKAYKEISAVTNIEFVEVATAAEADTNYYMGNLMDPFVGASAIAYNSGLVAWNNRYNYPAWGDDNIFHIILHEITHTLGMAHTSIGFKGDYQREDSTEFSHMSYNPYVNNSLFIDLGKLRAYDLAYLHYAFGTNQTVRTGDDIYTFKNYNMFTRETDRYIWDAGGTDTFDASAETRGVNVNLTPGSWIYSGNTLEKNFSVKSSTVHDMRSYFGLDSSAVLSNGNIDVSKTSVTLNTYTEGQAFIGYGTQIENLIGSPYDDVLTGNNAANNIYGGAGRDTIKGGAGNDHLDGGAGADIMEGGEGDDTYVVDDAADTVTETAGQGIADHVYSSIGYTLGNHLESLTLIGTTAIIGNGNGLDNTLTGNGADNRLNGGAGDDRIIGGAGSDTLTGGEGRDTFVFDHILDGSVDTITDFAAGFDMIELSRSIFDSLTADTMAEWEQYVRYDAGTGRLTYDSDGSGKAGGIHFATLDKDLEINQSNFNVV